MSTQRRVRLLRQADILRDADSAVLMEIAQGCSERDLEAGEQLCAAGDPGDALWIVTAGTLEVFREDVVLDTSGPGECLGEMSVLTEEGRSAAIRAATPASVLVVPRSVFRSAFERHPSLAWGVIRALAARARSSIQARVNQSHSHRLLEDAFVRSVSRGVLDEILRQPDPVALLEGRTVEATVLFADVRGFTSMAEGLDPREIVRILNEYLSAMVDTVLDAGGTLDKFLGDGLLAHFGVPLHGDQDRNHAVGCAARMLERLAELNRAGEFVSRHPLSMAIGLASGVVVAGCVGNARHMEYTAIGDVVNLAARLESLTKLHGVSVLMCGETARGLAGVRRIDRVRVHGKARPTDVFTLVPPEDRVARGGLTLADAHEAGLAHYMQGRFAEAAACFDAVSASFPQDGPSRVLAARCHAFVARPPQSWDGAFSLEGK